MSLPMLPPADELPAPQVGAGGELRMWLTVADFNRLNERARNYESLGGKPAAYDAKVIVKPTPNSGEKS